MPWRYGNIVNRTSITKHLANNPVPNTSGLLEKVAAGDEAAFAELFDTWRDKLFSFIFSLSRSRSHAEDVVQESFLKIWQKRAQLVDIRNFQAYLFQVARNHAIDQFRKLSRESAVFTLLQNLDSAPSTPDQQLQYKEIRITIEKAMATLPDRQKEVYLLHRQQGLKHDEIAARLGLSVSTVQNHLFRALENLRQQLVVKFPDINDKFPLFVLGIFILEKI